MNQRNKKESDKRGERKRTMRSGFNLAFTLLFVIFVAMVMLTMFNEDTMKNATEISPITFRKLLYSCRITYLQVVGHEKVEGQYLLDPDDAERFWRERPEATGTPVKDAGLGSFVVELSSEDLEELIPRFPRFLGRRVEQGDAAALYRDVQAGKVYVNFYYTVAGDTSFVPSLDGGKSGVGGREPPRGEDVQTELFVDFIDTNGTARFQRITATRAATALSSEGGLSGLLHAMDERFARAKLDSFSVKNEGSLKFNRPNTFWTTILAPLIPWLLIIGLLWFFIFRQMRMQGGGGNVLSFGRSRATLVTKEKTNVTFEDVAGIEEAKEEVVEIIEFLKNPQKFSRLGGRIPSGVLLVGPPGTGKTLLAKAIAGEADVPFFSICGSDFVEMFVGVGASRVRDLFRQARENSPCLIFLDEIDAVGRKRGSGLGGGHDEREQTLNAILVEMDGFDKDEGIILLAATNRPDVLDPALLRPGRFDREIVIDLPDLRGREEILKVHCRKIKMAESVDLSIVARGTPGFSGAELSAIVNEAALIATLKNRSAVEMADFEEARDKIRWGRQKKSRVMDKEDRLITAYHESGHALAAYLLPDAEEVHKVTIIPRGASLGATMILPEKDRYHYRRKELLTSIKVLYAGRIAEKMFCGDISGGAKNDIDRASETARLMVCQLGMSERLGPVSYGETHDHIFLGEDLVRARNHSEEVARQIDEEVREILESCYRETEELIEQHRDKVELIAQTLMKYETLTGEEVAAIIEGTPLEEIHFQYAPEKKVEVKPPAAPKPAREAPRTGEDLDPGDLPAAGEPAY